MTKENRPAEPAQSGAGATGETAAEGVSFEAAMGRLQEIVEKLESGELPLDESLRLFEEGVALSKRAGDLLGQAERKVEILTKVEGGELRSEPFDEDAGEA